MSATLNKFNHNHVNDTDVFVINKQLNITSNELIDLGTTASYEASPYQWSSIETMNSLLTMNYDSLIDTNDILSTPFDIGIETGTPVHQLTGSGLEIGITDGTAGQVERLTKTTFPLTANGVIVTTFDYSFVDSTTNALNITFGIKGLDTSNTTIFETSGIIRVNSGLTSVTRSLNTNTFDNTGSSVLSLSEQFSNEAQIDFPGTGINNTLYIALYGKGTVELGYIKDNVKKIFITRKLEDSGFSLGQWQLICRPYFKVDDAVQGTGIGTVFLNNISVYNNYDIMKLPKRDINLTQALTVIASSSIEIVAVRLATSNTISLLSKLCCWSAGAGGIGLSIFVDYDDSMVITGGAWVRNNNLEFNNTLTSRTGGVLVKKILFDKELQNEHVSMDWRVFGLNSLILSNPVMVSFQFQNLTASNQFVQYSFGFESV